MNAEEKTNGENMTEDEDIGKNGKRILIVMAILGIITAAYFIGIDIGKQKVQMPTDQIANNIEMLLFNTTNYPFLITNFMSLQEIKTQYIFHEDIAHELLKSLSYDICYSNITQKKTAIYFQFAK